MAFMKFYVGNEANASSHRDGIYIAVDTKKIYYNGSAYGGGNVDLSNYYTIAQVNGKIGTNVYTGANYISKETNLTEAVLQLDEEIKATNDNLALEHTNAEATYAKKTELGKKLDISTYTSDKATFALKSEIPNVSNFLTISNAQSTYLTKTDARNTYQPKGNYLTSVSIATISDLNANWDALLKSDPSVHVIRWPNMSEVGSKQNLVIKLNGGTTEGTNQFTYNVTAKKSINITPSSIGAAAASHSHNVITSRGNVTAESGTTVPAVYGLSMTQAYQNGYPTQYGNVISLRGSGSGEILIGWSGTSGAHAPAYIRSKRDTSDANWSGWAQIYTTANKPSASDIGAAAASHTHNASQISGLSKVATSGSYKDLTNKPSIPSAYTLPKATTSTLGGIKVGDGLEITGDGTLNCIIDPGSGTVSWGNIQGKPSVFATNIASINDLNSGWDALLKAAPNIPSLNGYATQEWVNGRGFLTKTTADGYYQPKGNYLTSVSWAQISGRPTIPNVSATNNSGTVTLKIDSNTIVFQSKKITFNGSYIMAIEAIRTGEIDNLF